MFLMFANILNFRMGLKTSSRWLVFFYISGILNVGVRCVAGVRETPFCSDVLIFARGRVCYPYIYYEYYVQ